MNFEAEVEKTATCNILCGAPAPLCPTLDGAGQADDGFWKLAAKHRTLTTALS